MSRSEENSMYVWETASNESLNDSNDIKNVLSKENTNDSNLMIIDEANDSGPSEGSSNVPAYNELNTIKREMNVLEEYSEVDELRKLLTEWKLDYLLDHLIANKIYIRVLKIMKPHHVERLLKDYDLGTQFTFESLLDEWRKSTPKGQFCKKCSSHSRSDASSRSSTPTPGPSSSRFSPYTRPSLMETDLRLSNFLNETVKGQMLVEYYNKYSKFTDDLRMTLINGVSQFFEDRKQPLTLGKSYKLEKEIIERFPSEKLEFYRSSKRGRIYNKFCNLKKSTRTTLLKHLDEEPPKKIENQPEEKWFEPEPDAAFHIRALKFDNLDADQFDRTWRACSNYRLNEIRKLNNIPTVFEKWPFYKSSKGFRLIDMDYSVAFENSDGLLNNIDGCWKKILRFLKSDNNIKDKNVKALLDNLDETIHENSRLAVIFWALHAYFVPTNKIVTRNECGKQETKKFTIKDSQQSFLYTAKTMQELEHYLDHLKSVKSNIQPFVYTIGSSILDIKEIYVHFHGIRYKFFSFVRAVDISFKIIYLFNLGFPPESIIFYSFLESFFYKLKGNTYTKVAILNEFLS